jgi:predicted ester cyclase
MNTVTEKNKAIVVRFNKEFIEQGKLEVFKDLVADDLFNHTAPPGASNGPDGMVYFLQHVLRAGFPDITVDILDQIAEGDKVTTRKVFHGTHTGNFMGIAATNNKVDIHVIDIIRLRDGKYVEHWGMSNLAEVAGFLKEA